MTPDTHAADAIQPVHSATPDAAQMPAPTRRKLKALFTPEQLAVLTKRSDVRGAWAIASTWGVIAAAFAVLAVWPNVFTFLLASAVIAGRQLCLAILQHEGSHGTLFQNRWANDVLTDWLCARPIWQNLPKYKVHHLGHHTRTGTEADPDISLHAGYPITPRSLMRKVLRDLSGLTGLKLVYGLLMMDAGVFKWTVANHIERLPQTGRTWGERVTTTARNMAPMLITNVALWACLAATGHAWLYGAWVVAYLNFLPLFVRIRSVAEHGCLARTPDMFLNTRTTRAGWLARMTVAPVHVNFHMEHHVMASVPCYRLPQMHAWLRAQADVPEPPGYLDVLKLASSR
ncbi:fatty acid desaturase [Aquabacterium commune]|uniref:Fatty acid desaturase n=2 Tax=Aquabacterium commune TaxID=70586 RepID=A0A4R6RN02_9BURK|nr:fatty acid desaturase family protein [Aquabacterium commune]TDP87964.1 fatty acid desaturase [Aquabacterium commune]